MFTRDEALSLLRSCTPEEHLLRHALASEAVMRALANHLGEDPDLWGLTGLLHDVDYAETHDMPERHGLAGAERIGSGLSEAALHAVRAHNDRTGIKPESRLDYALRCGETVTGLIMAAALVRPTGMDGMKVSGLKKKMKDKAFAVGVCRDTIRECTELGLDPEEFLELSVAALDPLAKELGLERT